jgi:rhodanese-related sulfurtransferase
VRRCFVALIVLLAPCLPVHAEVIDIGNEELARLLNQGVTIIDIRTSPEWRQTGIVEGSHLITFFDRYGRYDIPAWLEKVRAVVKPDEPVILICRTGSRTISVSGLLGVREGYHKVYNVRHGIVKWIAEKNPVVKPPG